MFWIYKVCKYIEAKYNQSMACIHAGFGKMHFDLGKTHAIKCQAFSRLKDLSKCCGEDLLVLSKNYEIS